MTLGPQTTRQSFSGARALVTGASGFIGTNLVRALKVDGADVSVLTRSPAPAGFGASSIVADIRDASAVDRAVVGVDLIFHMAGRSGGVASNVDPAEDLDVNSRGLLNVLDACRRRNPAVKIVFPSSRLVYAPTDSIPVPETAMTIPASIYGIHKLAAEQYLRLYSTLYGVRSTVLRITNPYGAQQSATHSRYSIVNWFINEAVNDHTLTVYGDGLQRRDYIHVADVVDAMLLAALRPSADGMVFNVGTGRGVSFVEMATRVVRTAKRGTIKHVPWPSSAAAIETGDFVADTSLIERTLGWRARVSFESGIDSAVAACLQSQGLPHEAAGLTT